MKRSFRGGTNRHRNDRRPLPQVSLRTWRRTAESSPKSRRTLSGKRQTTEAAFAEIRPSSSPAARVDQRPGRPHHRARHIRDGEAAPIRLGQPGTSGGEQSTGDERWQASGLLVGAGVRPPAPFGRIATVANQVERAVLGFAQSCLGSARHAQAAAYSPLIAGTRPAREHV